ncbi:MULTISPECIES: conjugal transfer protein TraD [Fusobacterium]|uniref:Conjugal transfer protein TraD n=1 Tax=Fusobacterium vincentii 4_1_13 TaxID=469606 RepID=A0A0M1VUH7_FUSVC|nr:MULTISPECIES: conjugal transfer protein TraD [Fusobacterium]EEO40273.1 hypothetical protein FSCG_00986 [Fusobacterium vincentii 4_1_13]ERT34859.1 hypothetical protein HMPREF1540_02021 [Fusobacterium nucleatum CTI-3]
MSAIFEIEKKISIAKTKINFLEKKIKRNKFKTSLDKRKERAHNLIVKGALLEMLGLEKENNEVILGFLSTFSKNEEKQEYYKKIGKELFKKLKKK